MNSVHTVALLLLYILLSCNNNSNQHNNTSQSYTDLTGEVFIVAPSIDPVSCVAYGECDCCASHYVFINDTDFIAVNYCLESDTYFKGSYAYNNNQVIFYADGQFVDKEYPMDEISDSSNIETEAYKIKSNKGKSIQFKWLRFECKNTTCFKTDEADSQFVTLDPEKDFEVLIREIKDEGIWSALGLK